MTVKEMGPVHASSPASFDFGEQKERAMTYIKGYAFADDWKIEATRRQARYLELGGDAARDNIIINSSIHYKRNRYIAKIPPDTDLTLLDILILCDRGNTSFGGTVEDNGEKIFAVSVYTD